jgi:hypothetical protein
MLLLKATLAAATLSLALLASAVFAPQANAELKGCNIRCADGSFCSTPPDATGSCTCTCSWRYVAVAQCSCTELKPSTSG